MSVRIAILVEGATEERFIDHLRGFLEPKLPGRMPRLLTRKADGRIPKGEALRKFVANMLRGTADHVIALTDVYTGSRDFTDAADAKRKMAAWVGDERKFHPHAAQYELEAWLLPYWPRIQAIAGVSRTAPSGPPEQVNHDRPPSRHLQELFAAGAYSKTRDVAGILKGQDLTRAINACLELRSFVNTILTLSGGSPV
jgi:hypothetical protein